MIDLQRIISTASPSTSFESLRYELGNQAAMEVQGRLSAMVDCIVDR
jgi:hypothetical protein